VIDNASASPRVVEAGSGKVVPGFHLTYTADGKRRVRGPDLALSPLYREFASASSEGALVCEITTGEIRRRLTGHRGSVRILGFTPDGSKLLTAGGDHTVLIWDMRLTHLPLPVAIQQETDAARLWLMLAADRADAAYLAMARFAREPEAAVKMARMRLKPATRTDAGSEAANMGDARAIELLETLGTSSARTLLRELARGHAGAFRTKEAERALARLEK
jgi:hypothetical protein